MNYVQSPTLPLLPSKEEIYFYLMAEIEPDLVLSQPELEAKYASETPEEGLERQKRYEEAFEAFGRAYKDYLAKFKHFMSQYNRDINAEMEAAQTAHLEFDS